MKSLFVMTALVIFFLSATAQELPTKPNLLTFHTGPLTEQVSNIVTNNDSLDIVLLDTKGEAVAKIPAWDSRDITPKAYLANQYLIQVFDSSSNKYKVSKLYPPKMEAYIPAGVFYFSEMVTGYYTDSVKYSDSEYYYSDSSFVELPKSEWHIDSSWMFRKIAVINYSYARPADLKFYFVLQNNHYSNDQI